MGATHLKQKFGGYGNIPSIVVLREGDGKFQCFGFVNFEHAADAALTVEGLHDIQMDAKESYFGTALKKSDRERFQVVYLYWKNLIHSTDDEQLTELVSEFAPIASRKVFAVDLIIVLRGLYDILLRIKNSATSLAVSIPSGDPPAKAGSLTPSLLESGKALTTKGMPVLELVGKETMTLLIRETGIEVEQNSKAAALETAVEQFEAATFDRCFYIYGGPVQLEELEALSTHFSLLFNRRNTKLSSQQKSFYDAAVKPVRQIFSLNTEMDAHIVHPDKGKNIETIEGGSSGEMNVLCYASVNKAVVQGFAAALGGLATKEIIQRNADRLETIHSEGVHRLSELCCNAVSQLLMLGNSVISNGSKTHPNLTAGTLANLGQTPVLINHSNPIWLPNFRVVSQMEPVQPLICRVSTGATQFHALCVKVLRVTLLAFISQGTCVWSELITP